MAADTLRIREQDLPSKVAVVTGASKGIGRAIALNFASRGCSILGKCSSTESLHHIHLIADEISKLYHTSPYTAPKIHGLVADVPSSNCHREIANAVQKLFETHVDIYVNNAAPKAILGIGSLEAEHIAMFYHANTQTLALIVDELVKRRMFLEDSRIVLISSARHKKVNHKSPMYCVTKSAGECLVRCWVEAFGGKDPEFDFMAGTTANTVLAGLTRTDATKHHGEQFLDQIRAEILPSQSIPRLAELDDVAAVVGLLCSREARWITGNVVSADGRGMKIR